MKTKFFSAVMVAMMLTIGSMGITASAEEATTERSANSVAEENSLADNSSVESSDEIDMQDFMDYMSSFAEDGNVTFTAESGDETSVVDYYDDDYYDTDGNATLITSEQIIYNTEEMQFIAVTTKDGHVFYVLINYSAASGEDSVYFLNKVDDYDLYALLYAGDEDDDDSSTITPEEAAQAAENANGRVSNSTDSDKSADEENADTEDTSESVQSVNSSSSKSNIYLAVSVLALISLGAAGFVLVKKKPKNKAAVEEIEGSEEDEDFNFYDNDESEDE